MTKARSSRWDKKVAAEYNDLLANVLSLRAELEQNTTGVANLSAEWTENVAELETKVAELERAERARMEAFGKGGSDGRHYPRPQV